MGYIGIDSKDGILHPPVASSCVVFSNAGPWIQLRTVFQKPKGQATGRTHGAIGAWTQLSSGMTHWAEKIIFFQWLSWKSQLAKADETFKFVLLSATPACSFEPQQWAYKGRSQEQKHHSWPTSPLACHGDLQMDQQRKPPNPKMHPTVVCGQRLYRVFVQFACCSWVKDFLKCQAGSCSKRMA